MLIPKWLFGAKITRLTDPNSTRYALGGVKLERDKETGQPIAVTTDGKQMLFVTWQERDVAEHPCSRGFNVEGEKAELSGSHANPDFEAIVPMKSWDEAERLISKSGKAILQNVAVDENVKEDMRVLMVGTDGDSERSLKIKQLDGRFPAWRSFISRLNDDNSLAVGLSVKLLAELCQVLSQIAEQENNHKVLLRIPFDLSTFSAISLEVSRADGAKAEGVLNGSFDMSEEVATRQEAVGKLNELRERLPAKCDIVLDAIVGVCSVGQINAIAEKLGVEKCPED